MRLLQRIWRDEAGFVASSDLILISTVLVIGVLVGLVTLRDQVVQELGDLGSAIGNLNQSYSFSAGTVGTFTVAGSMFEDLADDCEEGNGEGDDNGDTAGSPPGCINLSIPVNSGE